MTRVRTGDDFAARVHAHAPTWEMSLAQRLPLHPLVGGALVALLVSVLGVAYTWALGYPILGRADGALFSDPVSNLLLLAALVGYAVGGLGYGSHAVAATTPADVGLEDLRAKSEVSRRKSRRAGLVGVLFAFSVAELLIVLDGASPVASWLSPHDELHTLWLIPVLGWLGGRAVYFTLRGVARPVSLPERVDLLDLEPFHVLGRMGLRFALMWLIGVAIMIPVMIDLDDPISPKTPIVPLAIAVAGVAMLLPVMGARRQIRARKREEIALVDAALRGDRASAGRLAIASRAELGLADLIAYRGLIASVSEWPLDTTTVRRFALYMFIPLGSWVSAALVERVVNTWLD